MNPAPDADLNSVGKDNFDWIVDSVARLAVERAKANNGKPSELRWASLLGGSKPDAEKKPTATLRTGKARTAL
jgi:hypothetical protein